MLAEPIAVALAAHCVDSAARSLCQTSSELILSQTFGVRNCHRMPQRVRGLSRVDQSDKATEGAVNRKRDVMLASEPQQRARQAIDFGARARTQVPHHARTVARHGTRNLGRPALGGLQRKRKPFSGEHRCCLANERLSVAHARQLEHFAVAHSKQRGNRVDAIVSKQLYSGRAAASSRSTGTLKPVSRNRLENEPNSGRQRCDPCRCVHYGLRSR